MNSVENSNNKVLEVKGITKKYKNRTVLNDINFDIYAGEIFGFLGPNGAGKTTLIRIICGMTPPTSGEVFICGNSVQHQFKKAIVNLGAMIENCQAYSYMTGYQNLVYFASLNGNVDHLEIDKIVETVGMTNRIHDKFRTYSYGMRQRIALAQALLNKPKLLVLDEPTNGLDANGVIELRRTLKILAAREKMAIMVSSHILTEMELLCDSFAIVDSGKILELRSKNDQNENSSIDKQIAISVNYPNYACKVVNEKFNLFPEIAGNCILIPYNKELYQKIVKELQSKNIAVFGGRVESKSLEDLYLDILKNNRK